MKTMKRLFLSLAVLGLTLGVYAQGTVTGKVTDGESGSTLPGANIVEAGTTNGTITGADGTFSLSTQAQSGTLEISFLGYKTQRLAFTSGSDIGTISLSLDAQSMDEVVVVGIGVIDVAKDRETPVAVSTIKLPEIIAKTGNQEFPEIMKNTPSVYVASQAGGYGDSRIHIRGFSQENLALLFNGQPVNGMEDGKVYWSNWQGLSDVASAVQIQRGLGSSKLAISSVGATINIVTKATDMRSGGRVSAMYGNDNYMKFVGSVSTGLNEKGWGATVLLSHWQGDGYNDGNQGQGQSYLVSIGYKPNEKHQFNWSVTGAPQWHHQNFTKSLSSYDLNDDGEITNEEQRYNSNWGTLNGEVYSWRKNFYNKPVMNLNWDWNISEKANLSTVIYASWGQGGGTGPYGASSDAYVYGDDNQIDFDQIVANNESIPPDGNGYVIGGYGSAAIRRASMNIHNWYGAVSNFNYNINQNLSFNVGVDLRTYYGEHFRFVDDLLGLDAYWDDNYGTSNGFQITYPGGINYAWELGGASPYIGYKMRNMHDDFKIDYFNTERISYGGLFGQLEYKTEKISAYVQGALSNQSYQRFDYHTYFLASDYASDKLNFIGYNAKAGANYNINENHNVYANFGYYSRQPFFDDLFLNYRNDINEEVGNEGVLGIELGYGLRTQMVDLNVDFYSTNWTNRQLRNGVAFPDGSYGTAYYENVGQSHMGVELEAMTHPLRGLDLGAFVSIGSWNYSDNVISRVYDEDQNFLGESTLYLDGVKVGDAAQTSFGILAKYSPFKGFFIDADWRYYDALYAAIDPTSFTEEDHDGSLELPSFNILDAGVAYKLYMQNSRSLMFRFNVNNLLNKQYISQSDTNYHLESGDDEWNGVNMSNRVFFGNGITWNFGVTFAF